MTPTRFGLRARVIAAFGIGALLLSVLMAAATYSLTRTDLLERRQASAFSNAETNTRSINDEFSDSTSESDFVPLMAARITPEGTQQALLHSGEGYFVDPLRFAEDQLDPEFRDLLLSGRPAEMTYRVRGEPVYAVGLPLPSARANAWYIQVTQLGDLQNTFNTLLLTLLGVAGVTTILGLGFGVYVATRIFSPIGEISHAAGLIAEGDLSTRLEDVTDPDLDRLVSSFNEMTSALEERIERDSRFASDVSHELRSPLMTLTGSVAVLERRREDMPERAQLALDLLSADIKRFKLLVEDLLEISRFDVGAVQLDIEEVMLGEFVRQAIGAATGGTRTIPIIHDDDTDELIVNIDKRRIAQVIRNLSENADKYAEGVTQVRLVRDDDDVRIELEDEGPGVPVEERELIFERFARGSEGGRRGSGSGVGLGLSLVTEHLRLHGGEVWVTDRVDSLIGARFVISLPGVVVE